MIERTEELATDLRGRALRLHFCHADLHPGNVLITPDGALFVVDWDTAILAPRERDLMFVGSTGGVWTSPADAAAFYRGYGPVEVDLPALAYYRYARIVEDIDVYGGQLFDREDDDDARRAYFLRLFAAQFGPDAEVDIAFRTDSRPRPA